MNGNNYMKWLDHILNAVAIWPVTGQCFQNTEWRAILYILSKFHKSNKPANLNYHMSIKKVKRSRIQVWAFALRWAQKTKPCFVTLRTFFRPHMAICGKISGHKQFNVASAISNFKKFSLKIFLRLEELKQNQRTFGSVDDDFIKSNRIAAIQYSEILTGKMK